MTLDLPRDLPAALTDRTAAWRLVADLAAFWNAPLQPGDGRTDAELDAAEARLGLRLPAALREAHLLLGNRPDLTSNQDTLLPPEELYVDRDHLVYRVENQSCAYWGVPLAALDQDDPPTVVWPDAADPETAPWTARLSVECLAVVLTEPLFDEDAHVDAGEVDPASLTGWTELPRLYEPGIDTRFFARPDALLAVQGDSWLALRATSEEALDALCEQIEVSWLRS
ncbi:SMI1/KNR4 family protein [Kitasatospora sp. YST-16]|uniref:SMI1/KNR4 family protein n=1 Tax=Kitasatospora sp. YST-16 TaxID=2998080 RepID=UPI0022834995|nr:SMI1/KNR4 family protein [Kitasatospora sp. YST-16]WAL74339.1 SMI1/KNR4 family protein [Kitasatospora sp. YST-16]WNW40405.1 SMI1/KNR4 family protein [Streptomyces sp. Li-HN-5-13]